MGVNGLDHTDRADERDGDNAHRPYNHTTICRCLWHEPQMCPKGTGCLFDLAVFRRYYPQMVICGNGRPRK